MVLQRRSLNRDPVKPLPLSIGGWCLVNRGADPFGDPVRDPELVDGLQACKEAGITHVSFHDRDLYPDDALPTLVDEQLAATEKLLADAGLQVLCFTTNLFSNPCFRSGAFSSPLPKVRQAAIVKACRAMDAAARLDVRNIIFWGGREGTEVLEQDPGEALARYLHGVKTAVLYAIGKGYQFTFTIEPKVYEPRFDLYGGTAGALSSAIRHCFPEQLLRQLVKINPEYPQHVAMLGLNPALELGQLIEEGMLGCCIHFGGQRPCRMDADFPPGIGGSAYDDFTVCKLLHDAGYDGFVEFDCRPLRTSTTADAYRLFARQCVSYWRSLERKVEIFRADPIIAKLQADIFGKEYPELDALMAEVGTNRESKPMAEIVNLVERLGDSFYNFGDAESVNTDAIEAYGYRVQQIVCGTHVEGTAMFAGTRWASDPDQLKPEEHGG